MTRQLFAAAVVAVFAGFGSAADKGLAPGNAVPGPFAPLNINGGSAGEKHCLFCENGQNPVAMLFVRDANNTTTQKLIKAIDDATAKNAEAKMGSFVVVLSDEEKLEGKLKDLVAKEKYKKVVLSIDTPSGPAAYKVDKDADVVVVLYTGREVKVNHTFKKGELKDGDIEKVVADVAKIVK